MKVDLWIAEDYKIITSVSGQKAYARAISESLIEMYGLKKKTVVKPKPVVENITVTYQTYDSKSKRWLPNVTDWTDDAGIFGRPISGVYANLSKGNITYKVHTKGGKWLPAVSKRNGYAGIKGNAIDGLMVTTDTGKTVKYRVHLKATNKWLPWVTGYDATDHNNGYAGIIGKEIDAIQIDIV